MEESPGEITRLLAQIKSGNRDAESRLIPLVYSELRRLASHYMRQENPGHTLQATALVHEAYLRLVGDEASLRRKPGEGCVKLAGRRASHSRSQRCG